MQKKLAEQADDQKAREMRAYMKIATPFYGVQSPERKAIFKEARAHTTIDNLEQFGALVRWLWCGNFREEQYLALDVAEHYKKLRTVEAFPLFVELLESADHWDTLDKIASNLIGPLLLKDPSLKSHILTWRESENMWLRRASLLVHLKHKDATDVELLTETIGMLAEEDAFFIRKAIGWVLREYSKTDPTFVREFLKVQPLSPLSYREANRIMISINAL
ncbi:DNA alkylation repair protein [Thaumasiovibrio subtropicus]|nr:DNA alkylation repair protein [Thaumasiovibrio subtropicus]